MRLGCAAFAILLGGCFVDRSGTWTEADAGAPRGEGGVRFEPFDAAARPDVGTSCVAEDERCEGELAILCEEGTPRVVDCVASNAWCDDTGERPRCVARVCVPGAGRCNGDGSAALRCDARGAGEVEEPCPRGCADGACVGETACTHAIHAALTGDAEALAANVCDHGAELDYAKESGDGCDDALAANGGDLVLRLTLAAPRRYRFDVRDVDGPRRVDPVVYVWSDCGGAPAAQAGCDDQGGDVDDDARLELDLGAGDWFVVVDVREYDPAGLFNRRECGAVEIAVTPL